MHLSQFCWCRCMIPSPGYTKTSWFRWKCFCYYSLIVLCSLHRMWLNAVWLKLSPYRNQPRSKKNMPTMRSPNVLDHSWYKSNWKLVMIPDPGLCWISTRGLNLILMSESDQAVRIWGSRQNLIPTMESDLYVRIWSLCQNLILLSESDSDDIVWSWYQNLILMSESDLYVRIWSLYQSLIMSSELDTDVIMRSLIECQSLLSPSDYSRCEKYQHSLNFWHTVIKIYSWSLVLLILVWLLFYRY